jgi:tyrosine-specific transport protein
MTTQNSSGGSLFGAILLIASCCIGAGMLGLPVMSALAGFEPSLLMFVLSWLLMTTTGLLLLEVNLWFSDDAGIISMAERTLGKAGKFVSWAMFLFLFYSLLVAYVLGSGYLIADLALELFNYAMPAWTGSLVVMACFAVCLYLGTKAVDWFNRLLMLGLVFSYVFLVGLGSSHVNTDLLKHRDWSLIAMVIPTMILSFGFHNLIPSLTSYLKHDVKSLRLAVIIGSAIPLVIYLVWEWLILGLVPVEGEIGFRQALDNGQMATQALKAAVGSSFVVELAQYFAFFAIITSFLGVSLSFVDFLSDGMQIEKTPRGKIALCLMVLVPPGVFAFLYPKIFLVALNYAGGVGAMTLFGIIPVLMAWVGRYHKKLGSVRLVPGGRVVLVIILLLSCLIIGLQLSQDVFKS